MADQVIDNSENQVADNVDNLVVVEGEEFIPTISFKKKYPE